MMNFIRSVSFTISVTYCLISVCMGKYYYSHFSQLLKTISFRWHAIDFIDVLGLSLEMAVTVLMFIATVITVKGLDDILDILFNFAGLLVVLTLDNVITSTHDIEFQTSDFPQTPPKLGLRLEWLLSVAMWLILFFLPSCC